MIFVHNPWDAWLEVKDPFWEQNFQLSAIWSPRWISRITSFFFVRPRLCLKLIGKLHPARSGTFKHFFFGTVKKRNRFCWDPLTTFLERVKCYLNFCKHLGNCLEIKKNRESSTLMSIISAFRWNFNTSTGCRRPNAAKFHMHAQKSQTVPRVLLIRAVSAPPEDHFQGFNFF